MSLALNLARRPFTNARPVVRVAVLLWVAGAALLVTNAGLFWSYRTGSTDKQAELASLQAQVEGEQRRARGLDEALQRERLPKLNDQVDFLNRRIAERTFGWGRLFDRLGSVLPIDVRIESLSPLSIAPEERRSGAPRRSSPLVRDRFNLHVRGVARNDDALLRFIDGLFQSPYFDQPDLVHEDRGPEGLRFDMTVSYLAAATPAAEPAKAEANPGAKPEPGSKLETKVPPGSIAKPDVKRPPGNVGFAVPGVHP